jgi:hypothetical protein
MHNCDAKKQENDHTNPKNAGIGHERTAPGANPGP